MITTQVFGTVPGTVIGQTNITTQSKQKPPGSELPRAVNYYADYSGCGFWRMIWPEHILNAHSKMVITGLTNMIRDPHMYHNIKSIRLQRQAAPHQYKFLKELRKIADKQNFKLIFEIDDIMFREDIPEYNKFRFAFEPDDIRQASQESIEICDQVTCTCDYMRDYYMSKTSNSNIKVIPNYPPKFCIGNLYDEDVIIRNYDRHVKKRRKPRILYAGSGAHFDVGNQNNGKDDFSHVLETVMKTTSKYQWVFLGAYPLQLNSLVKSGKIEFHPWAKLYDYGDMLKSLKVNCLVAPLLDNIFNRSKSDIKYVEACALGVPIICQDIITYDKAPLRFNTGSEMIDQIDNILKDKQQYIKHCRKSNMYAQTRWLENDENISKYLDIYTS